jgi:hypothetical protein
VRQSAAGCLITTLLIALLAPASALSSILRMIVGLHAM